MQFLQALLLCLAALTSQAATTEPLPVAEVAPGIYVHHGAHEELDVGYHGDICNIGFIVGRDGVVRRLNVTGPLVGALDAPVYGSETVHLAAGEMFFMCSDGVPEARRNDDVFGDRRLEALLSELSDLGPQELITRLEAEIVRFVAGRQRDDLAFFAMRPT